MTLTEYWGVVVGHRCGPCRQIAPAYEELSNQYPNVLFLKVNVDENEVNQLFCLIMSGFGLQGVS